VQFSANRPAIHILPLHKHKHNRNRHHHTHPACNDIELPRRAENTAQNTLENIKQNVNLVLHFRAGKPGRAAGLKDLEDLSKNGQKSNQIAHLSCNCSGIERNQSPLAAGRPIKMEIVWPDHGMTSFGTSQPPRNPQEKQLQRRPSQGETEMKSSKLNAMSWTWEYVPTVVITAVTIKNTPDQR